MEISIAYSSYKTDESPEIYTASKANDNNFRLIAPISSAPKPEKIRPRAPRVKPRPACKFNSMLNKVTNNIIYFCV